MMLVNQIYQGGIRALLDYDNTVFDNFVSPEDPDGVAVDAQLIIDNIIYKYGDAPLFTPDPAVMKYYIGVWSTKRKPLWDRFYRAILEEYDPLHNYDRNEKITDELTHGHTVTTDDDLTGGLTIENQISADNAGTYQPDSKSINGGKDERDITEKHTGKDTHIITTQTYGNIGVTTSQQMLKAEIDLLPALDIINYIADDFHEEFNLMMYN